MFSYNFHERREIYEKSILISCTLLASLLLTGCHSLSLQLAEAVQEKPIQAVTVEDLTRHGIAESLKAYLQTMGLTNEEAMKQYEEGIAGGYFTVFNLCKTLKRWCFENIKRIEKDEKTKING